VDRRQPCWPVTHPRRRGRSVAVSLPAVLYLAMCIELATSGPAAAYVDLGTGSYIFQLAVGAMLGALYFLRAYLSRAFGFLRRPKRAAQGDRDADE